MNLLTIILIALALAMDAFAVSISSGAVIHNMRFRHALRVGLFFGGFQAGMPLLGWGLGQLAAEIICAVDHWISFGLLLFVGIKMLWESRPSAQHCDDDEVKDPLDLYVLVMLSIATSIDAAAIGVTLSFLDVSILFPVIVIGIVTFLVSVAGMYIGMYACSWGGDRFSSWMERAGGVVLIGLGIKILLESLLST